jgi:DNA-binding transcriptional ArsR family regulator
MGSTRAPAPGERGLFCDPMEARKLDAKRLSAIAHPLRVQILAAAEAEAVSPSDLAVALCEPLGVVAYHFRVLHTVGLIELVATERRRGSIQSFYRATGRGWTELATTLESVVGRERDVQDLEA